MCVCVCMCIPLFSSIPSCSLLKRSSHVVYKLFVPYFITVFNKLSKFIVYFYILRHRLCLIHGRKDTIQENKDKYNNKGNFIL